MGSRIRVAQIVTDYLAHGWSPDEICRHYPHLFPAEARAAMTYYYDHQPELADQAELEGTPLLAAVQAARRRAQ